MKLSQARLPVAALLLIVSGLFGQEKKRFSTTADIVKLMTESALTYRIESLDKLKPDEAGNLPGLLFPPSCPAVANPRLVMKDGSAAVEEFPFKEEAVALVRKAESIYQEKKYEEARRIYAQAVQADPDCYLAVADIGDCYYFTGRHEQALAEYDKAILINPHDHRLYFFRANALLALGRTEEAKKNYLRSLMLRPRYPFALQVMKARRDVLKMDIRESLFQPPLLVRKEGDDICIYLDAEKGGAHWMAYANAKAVWLGEPSHRQEIAGDSGAGWSTIQERECLSHLLTVYLAGRADNSIPLDPNLEILKRIVENGDMDYFILYEIYTRLCPYGMVTLSEVIQQEMERFIEKYLVVYELSK